MDSKADGVKELETKKSLLEEAEKQLQSAKDERESNKASNKTFEDQLEKSNREVEAAKAAAKAAETALATATAEAKERKAESAQKDAKLQEIQNFQGSNSQAQSGILNPTHKGWSTGQDQFAIVKQEFPASYSSSPRLIFGLRVIDLERSKHKGIVGAVKELTNTGFSAKVHSFGGCYAYNADMSWLTLPNNGIHFENGSYNTGDEVGRTQGIAPRVHFAVPFNNAPKVCCWLNEINMGGNDWLSLRAFARDISPTSFILDISTWAGRSFEGARVSWFAYDSAEDGKRVKSGISTAKRDNPSQKLKAPFYGSPFSKKPATFIALSEVDFSMDRNIRANTEIVSATATELEWSFGTWADSNMDHMHVTWIAVE